MARVRSSSSTGRSKWCALPRLVPPAPPRLRPRSDSSFSGALRARCPWRRERYSSSQWPCLAWTMQNLTQCRAGLWLIFGANCRAVAQRQHLRPCTMVALLPAQTAMLKNIALDRLSRQCKNSTVPHQPRQRGDCSTCLMHFMYRRIIFICIIYRF